MTATPQTLARRRRVTWLLGGVIVPLALFFMPGARTSAKAQMTAFDESVLRAVAQVHGDAATAVMRALTFFGGFLARRRWPSRWPASSSRCAAVAARCS